MNLSSASPVELAAAVIFAVALAHTFSTGVFERLASRQPQHAGLWHLLGEVEVVFGFWALVLMLLITAMAGGASALRYLESRDFTEPMFVFVIMVIAGARPVLDLAALLVRRAAQLLPFARGAATYFLVLALVPLLGSFITEPAAMTVAALLLRDAVLPRGAPASLRYATLGVLFVNVSIGGTLTPFAAPPVLMVAGDWGWDIHYMLTTFGWKAAVAVAINAAGATFIFRRLLEGAAPADDASGESSAGVMALHVAFLVTVVAFAHHPVVFIPVLLFFLGYATAYPRHQGRLILREALLVAFFLAGLVVLAGQQQWWLRPLLAQMGPDSVYYGATVLTAITDNAAITYLASLVEGLSEEFKVAVVAGAVTGGGLTIIANAPNPAGASILKDRFPEGGISPLGLFIAAVPPTLVAAAAFRLL